MIDKRWGPREYKKSRLFLIRCGDSKCRWTGHIRQEKPGPWRLLQKSTDSWMLGLKCPVCKTPVEFQKRKRRAECPGCGCRVDRDGKTGVKCDHCGRYHWTESSKGWCKLYETLRGVLSKDLAKALPEGSKEPPPWGSINAWGDVRDGMMSRDGHTCQECGIHQSKMWDMYLKAKGLAPDTEPWDLPQGSSTEAANAMTIQVHHVIPRIAGGTDHPENLITLCYACHRARHDAIGNGFHPYLEVSMAIITDDVVGEDRAALLAGDHPILEEVARKKELRALPERERRLLIEIEVGTQRVLEVDG
jgi:hypothetical protein